MLYVEAAIEAVSWVRDVMSTQMAPFLANLQVQRELLRASTRQILAMSCAGGINSRSAATAAAALNHVWGGCCFRGVLGGAGPAAAWQTSPITAAEIWYWWARANRVDVMQ